MYFEFFSYINRGSEVAPTFWVLGYNVTVPSW